MGSEMCIRDSPSAYSSKSGYIGRVGASKYNSVVESYNMSGFAVVLIFGDGTSDGFRLSELTLIS